uniref:Uncharacterized protein n=1 Tax=Bionectria ochroleuca TaxID=29856 RepID=A0A0B7K4U5_BIOOC
MLEVPPTLDQQAFNTTSLSTGSWITAHICDVNRKWNYDSVLDSVLEIDMGETLYCRKALI